MKKTTFHLCTKEEGRISAVKVQGYADGDIGVHKTGNSWQATHIPTGLLCQRLGWNKTKKAALENALEVIAEKADKFEQVVQKRLESAEHAAFLEAKKDV